MADEAPEDLRIAKMLADSDLSRESRIRESLKRRLLGTGAERSFWGRFRLLPPPRQALVLGAALGGFLIVALAAIPPVSASLRTFLSRWLLGARTEVASFVPERIASSETRPRTWIVQTSIGNFSGDVPAGAAPELRLRDSLAGARADLPDLRLPGWLPSGFSFHSAILTPLGGAVAVYAREQDELVVYQTPSHVRHVIAADMLRVQVAGTQAGWVEDGYGLVWEKDGVSFNVGGRGLVLEDALRVAESLRKEAL